MEDKMKKILRVTLALLVVIAGVVSLFSCFGTVADEGSVTVVIELEEDYTVYTVELENVEVGEKGALAILEYLSENEEMHLVVNGTYIEELGALIPDAGANQYVSIYTSEEVDFGVAPFDTKVEYNGQTLTASGVGINSMTVNDGTVILFRMESY